MKLRLVPLLALWLLAQLLTGCLAAQVPAAPPMPTATSTARPTRTPTLTSTPTRTATASPTPTLTPTVTDTPGPTSTPSPTATPSPTPVCDCSGNHYDCPAFSTQAGAQACFAYCWQQVGFDVHHFDADEDGQACESLP